MLFGTKNLSWLLRENNAIVKFDHKIVKLNVYYSTEC